MRYALYVLWVIVCKKKQQKVQNEGQDSQQQKDEALQRATILEKENGMLKSELTKLESELSEYKNRLSTLEEVVVTKDRQLTDTNTTYKTQFIELKERYENLAKTNKEVLCYIFKQEKTQP